MIRLANVEPNTYCLTLVSDKPDEDNLLLKHLAPNAQIFVRTSTDKFMLVFRTRKEEEAFVKKLEDL